LNGLAALRVDMVEKCKCFLGYKVRRRLIIILEMNYLLKLKALQIIENRRVYLKVYNIYLLEMSKKKGKK